MDPDSLPNLNQSEGDSEVESGIPDTDESLSEGFLKGVDPADAAIVQKYIKDWDAGVTKRFQAIHKQYEPYKNLGADPEYLQQALHFATVLDQDPYTIYNAIRQGLTEMYGDDFETQFGQDDSNDDQGYQGLPEYEGVPEPFLRQYQAMEQKVAQFEQFMNSQTQSQQEAEEMKLLDSVMGDLHTRHGDFDDDWVLVKIANGMEPEAAVAAYNKFVESAVSSHRKKPAPPVLGGPGGIPGQVDTSKINNPRDRKALIASILEHGQS